MSSSPIDKNTCQRCKTTKANEDMAGFCLDWNRAYCYDCYWSGKVSKMCDEIDCRLHWHDECWKCEGCDIIYDPDVEDEEGNDGDICLTRGLFCYQCWDSYESLEECRKKGCEMCERIYEVETSECFWCKERKADVDEDHVCGACRHEGDTPDIGYSMKPEEERDWAEEQKENEACFVERIARLNVAREEGRAPYYEGEMDLLLREREGYRQAYAEALKETTD